MTQDSGKKPVIHKKHVARQQREQQQTRLILYTFFGILAVVVALLIYGWLDINFFQINRPVAKVGETEITARNFEARVRLQRQNLLTQYAQYQQYAQFFGMDFSSQLQQIEFQLSAPETVGQIVLDQMINEEIVRQEAEKRGITVSEEELDEAIRAGYDFYPNGSPTPTITPTQIVFEDNSPEIFELVTATPQFTATPESSETESSSSTEEADEPTATATIAPSATPTAGPTATALPTSTPYTQEGYEQLLADTDENLEKFGFDQGYYREFYEYQLLLTKLKEEIAADVATTDTQVWARHILVEDEETAKGVIQSLQEGKDFAELARALSTDTGSGAQGGDLGWFGKGAMVAEFEAAAFALEKSGDITTEPVQSSFGYHIIQLIDKQERPLTAEQLQSAKDAAFDAWLTTIREEYSVETFDFWRQRVPNEPSFISAATEAAAAQQTSQAESVATLEAAQTETPQP
jgi:parvulin-like peptidyl-prolyl isomerase